MDAIEEEAYHCLHQVRYDDYRCGVVPETKLCLDLYCHILATVTSCTALSVFTESVLSSSTGIKIQSSLVVLTTR